MHPSIDSGGFIWTLEGESEIRSHGCTIFEIRAAQFSSQDCVNLKTT